MIDYKTLVYIVLGTISLIGGIVTFFVMQNTQNMRLKAMEKSQETSEHKISEQSKYQIQTEKNIIEINGNLTNLDDKMDMVLAMMQDLKMQGCGRCLDKT